LRTAYRIWSGIAAGVFCIVAVTDMASTTTTPTPTPASTGATSREYTAPTSAAHTPPATAALAASAPQPASGELVSVTKVVDGDTIEVTGGQTVRFLGIDACEMSTKGGREAKDMLELHISGGQVRLVADGRRDTDDYGRLLRRVERVSSYSSQQNPYANDIGVTMISDTAVGLYTRKNDATPAYLSELRQHDVGHRDCSGTPEVPSVGGSHNSRDRNMPDGALTGGFCARKWWC
jgi:endonuclease YncB( thermonuclease family)